MSIEPGFAVPMSFRRARSTMTTGLFTTRYLLELRQELI